MTTTTSNRIHPLMAAAAVSVTILGLVGAAAIAGLLPNSRGAAAPGEVTPAPAVTAATPLAAPLATAPVVAAVAAAPVAAPEPVQHRSRVHHNTQVAYQDDYRARDDRQYQPAPAPQAAAQPNYVGIGAGAVLGGLLANQVGHGRGKALATVAGVIGGGMLGNAVQNQVQQPQR